MGTINLDIIISIQKRAQAVGVRLKKDLAREAPIPAVLYYPATAHDVRALIQEGMLPVQHMQLGKTPVLEYGFKTTWDFLQTRLSAAADEAARAFAVSAITGYNFQASCFNCFLACLSENEAYWPETSTRPPGYHLGLETAALPLCQRAEDPAANLLVQPAIYDCEEQRKILDALYDASLSLYLRALQAHGDDAAPDILPSCLALFLEHSADFLPRFRPPSLRHEKEWTAILLGRKQPDHVEFEIFENRFLPYMKVDITSPKQGKQRIPLRCVSIDPSLPFYKTREGLTFFLARNGYSAITIAVAQDSLYEQVFEWVKADNAMTIARVQIRLRLGYSRTRQLVVRARRALHIDEGSRQLVYRSTDYAADASPCCRALPPQQ